MNQIHIKNRLYVLPILLFCVSLQSTEATQQNSTQSNSTEPNTAPANIKVSLDLDSHVTQQTLESYDLNLNRKHNHHKPKPSNAESYHNTESYHHTQSYNMIESQNIAGFLDSSFGGGYVINTMGHKSEPRAVAIQENNKVVIAGIRDDYPLLIRHNNDGSLDKTFGIGTYGPGVTIQISLGKNSSFNAVAIQPQCDQKIVAVGSSAGKCLLARYLDNGTLDTLYFGNKGIVQTDITGELTAVAVQKDGKIVVAGHGRPNNSPNTQMIVMRYNTNGTPDNSFGQMSIIVPILSGQVRAHKITILGNNKIIVVGSKDNDTVVLRLFANGFPDHTFGLQRGYNQLSIGKSHSAAYDVVIQNDGRIVVVGTSISQNDKSLFTVIRLDENGFFDTSFNGNGVATITPTKNTNDNAYARSVALDENEKIIVMGYTITPAPESYNYFSLARYDQDGALNASFSKQGTRVNLLQLYSLFNKISIPAIGAIQNDRKKLVLAGIYSNTVSPTGNLMAVVRYLN